jgi:hypothetical protein
MEDQAEDEQDQRAAYANVHSPELKTAASTTTACFIAAIFDIGAVSTGRPTHRFSPSELTGEMVTLGIV